MSHVLDYVIKGKQPEHDEIARLTAEFEAKGGKVSVYGNNVYVKPEHKLNFRDEAKKAFKDRVKRGIVK